MKEKSNSCPGGNKNKKSTNRRLSHVIRFLTDSLFVNENYMRLRPPLILSVPDAVTS